MKKHKEYGEEEDEEAAIVPVEELKTPEKEVVDEPEPETQE